MVIVRAERNLEQRLDEIVSGIAPIEPRMRHQNGDAGIDQHENRAGDQPVCQPHPQPVATRPDLRFGFAQSHTVMSVRLDVDDFLGRDIWATRRVTFPQIDLGDLVTAWRNP